MRTSKDGRTVGTTLRIDKLVWHEYECIALRANLIENKKGRPGKLTAQDVIRHRLYNLPLVKAKLSKRNDSNDGS